MIKIRIRGKRTKEKGECLSLEHSTSLTKEEQKALRLRVQDLLDVCEGMKCKYRSRYSSGTKMCAVCPIGKKMQEIGKKLWHGTHIVTEEKKWTEEDDLFVIENYSTLSISKIADILGFSPGKVDYRIRILQSKGLLKRKRA